MHKIRSLESSLVPVFGKAINPFVDGKKIFILGASTAGLLSAIFPKQVLLAECDKRRLDFANKLYQDSTNKAEIIFKMSELSDLRIENNLANLIVSQSNIIDWESYRMVEEKINEIADSKPFVPDQSQSLVLFDLIPNRLNKEKWEKVLAEANRIMTRNGILLVAALVTDALLNDQLAPVSHIFDSPLRFLPEMDLYSDIVDSGFYGVCIEFLSEFPVDRISGIEVRAIVIKAYKGKDGLCLDQGHAVVYQGPWSAVEDDDDHRYVRGVRTAVCAKTYDLLRREPYQGCFVGLPPPDLILLKDAPLFDCNTPLIRDVGITRGERTVVDTSLSDKCDDSKGCC